MLRNCVLLVHTNMLDPTQLVQINMPVSFLSNMLDATAVMVSAGRFSAKNLLKKKSLHETMQIPVKISFMLPRVAKSVKNEWRCFMPGVQKRDNSHKSSRPL